MEDLSDFLNRLGLSSFAQTTDNSTESGSTSESLLSSVDVQGVVDYIKSEKCKKIITMAGAGISTSVGIPDFRSPSSGIYANLAKYDLPTPEAMFDIRFFRDHPEPFFELAKELWPGTFKPSVCHFFIRLLNEKGLLLKHFTQNVDMLERRAGIPAEKLVEAHGTFYTSHCLDCGAVYDLDYMKAVVLARGVVTVPRCVKTPDCGGIVKPDIVFFGESLPSGFAEAVSLLRDCDLLMIFGTSLTVQPFASLPLQVRQETPRLYVNLENPFEKLDDADPSSSLPEHLNRLLFRMDDFQFGAVTNRRDVYWQGTTDDGCQELARLLGWKDDLEKLIAAETKRLNDEEKSGEVAEQTSSAENSQPKM